MYRVYSMKRVVIEVPKDKSDKIRDKFKDTIYSSYESEKSTRFILYVPDEMLGELIHQTNGSVKGTQPSRPLWTGLIPDYESLAKMKNGASSSKSQPPTS